MQHSRQPMILRSARRGPKNLSAECSAALIDQGKSGRPLISTVSNLESRMRCGAKKGSTHDSGSVHVGRTPSDQFLAPNPFAKTEESNDEGNDAAKPGHYGDEPPSHRPGSGLGVVDDPERNQSGYSTGHAAKHPAPPRQWRWVYWHGATSLVRNDPFGGIVSSSSAKIMNSK
jgi:hypothetical protein